MGKSRAEGQVRGEEGRSTDMSAQGAEMWLGQLVWDLGFGVWGRAKRGRRIFRQGCWEQEIRWKFPSQRQKGRDVSSGPATSTSRGSHRRGWGGAGLAD